jgi:hypothetical protein
MHAINSNESFCNVTMHYHRDSTIKEPKHHNLEFVSECTREENRFCGHWDYRSKFPVE